MELAPGARLGPYEALAPLGAGGMGEVWKARDTRLGREVAIKIIVHENASDPTLKARFEREARALSSLNHPNIVSVYDVGEQDGAQYIVSELVRGESLRQVIQRGPVPSELLIAIGLQVSRALAVAHAAGIVHRDLKPENIMLTADGAVKILDFGLARHVRHEIAGPGTTLTQTTVTQPGAVMGTAGYMSPEQICGEEADSRSDIFSLGVVLLEMASGERAFQGRNSVETMSAILKDEPAQLRRNASGALYRIIRRCLEKDPAKRYQSAAEVTAALETVDARPRLDGRWIAVAAAALVLAAGGAYWQLSRKPIPPPPAAPAAPPAAVIVPAPPPVTPPKPAPKVEKKAAVPALVPPPNDAVYQQAYEEGMLLLSQRKWPAAAERLSDAIKLKPDAGLAYLGRCHAVTAQQDYPRTIADCSQAIRLLPNSPDAYHLRADAYLLTQQFDHAVEDINSAIRLNDPDLATAHNIRGRAHSGLKEWGAAIDDFDQAIQLNPQAPHFYLFRGIALNARSQYRKAIEDFTKALSLQPNMPLAYTQRAIARQRTGDSAGAAQDRTQARSLHKQ